MRAVIIGAGVSGLTVAYRLLKKGFQVTVLDQNDHAGGLAASTRLGDSTVDRHFHFFCISEHHFRNLASELSIDDQLVWSRITRAVQLGGRIHPISTPLDVLRFSPLSLFERVRFAVNVLKGRRLADVEALDRITAEAWLSESVGPRVYDTMWKPLLDAKFGRYASRVSAAWLCARQKMQQEKVAFLKGGGACFFVERLADEVVRLGGDIRLSHAASAVSFDGDTATGVLVHDRRIDADVVVSTLPIPRLLAISGGPLLEYLKPYASLDYIGVVSAVILLKRPLSPYFWLNTNDMEVSFPGVVDVTNLDPEQGDSPHVVYVPQYCAVDDVTFAEPEETRLARILDDFPKISRGFSDDWVLDARVTKDCFAQHVCTPGMLGRIPPPRTSIKGLFMTEWSQFYPNDRSVNNSIGIANACFRSLLDGSRSSSGHGQLLSGA